MNEQNEKQAIEEMAKDLCENYNDDGTCYCDGKPCDFECENFTDAQYIYVKSYRKQIEGEWVWKMKIEPQAQNRLYCSVCDKECLAKNNYYVKSNFCPHCGAHMKGGAE